MGQTVYKITKHYAVPLRASNVSADLMKEEEEYLSLLNGFFSSVSLYYSKTMDLTLSAQQAMNSPDSRFFWNEHLLEKIIHLSKNHSLKPFIVPVICGFVETFPVQLNGKSFTYSIISRRSRFRAGTRFNVRGIDDAGNVANFVETEQLVHYGDKLYSYLQTRGSIPLFWNQITNTKYTPQLEVIHRSDTFDIFKLHFDDQYRRYGRQIAVNLINKHGYESPLGEAFAFNASRYPTDQLRYVHFDFHKECKKMRWDRLSLLCDQVQDEFNVQGFTLVENGNVIHKQQSVFRTNCMDCLDRTNVVQGMFARKVLNIQLKHAGILSNDQTVEKTGEFENMIKHVWADNADEISRQYSGTGALKTDFTRTGKRTKMGIVNDGMNSVIRYIKNNYMDGRRQDGFDLFLGEVDVSLAQSPFMQDSEQMNALMYPIGLVISILLFIWTLNSRFASIMSQLNYLFITLLMIVLFFKLTLRNGTKLVNQPKLKKISTIYTSSTMTDAGKNKKL